MEQEIKDELEWFFPRIPRNGPYWRYFIFECVFYMALN